MLKLTLHTDDYLSISDNIVIQLSRVAGGHAEIAVHAPRDVPVLRGSVLERLGRERPACLAPPKRKKKYTRDRYFSWNDDRERAVRIMKQVIDQIDRNGNSEEAAVLRRQLDRIIPPVWEDEIDGKQTGMDDNQQDRIGTVSSDTFV